MNRGSANVKDYLNAFSFMGLEENYAVAVVSTAASTGGTYSTSG